MNKAEIAETLDYIKTIPRNDCCSYEFFKAAINLSEAIARTHKLRTADDRAVIMNRIYKELEVEKGPKDRADLDFHYSCFACLVEEGFY